MRHVSRFGRALLSFAISWLSVGQVWAQQGGADPAGLIPVTIASGALSPRPTQTAPPGGLLTRDEAIRLALAQASAFAQAILSERSAAEDVKQARIAFLPRLSIPSVFTYNSPIIGTGTTAESPPGSPKPPSFINANSVREYITGMGVEGDVDLAGRLRATLRRNRALLEAAHAGTEVARRALVQATVEAYYQLSLSTARRQAAEQTLKAAEDFERITSMLLSGGEVAAVDLVRARLQTTTRRDEMEQARSAESAAADSLRALVGYTGTAPIMAMDLMASAPIPGEVDQYTADMIASRPELAALDAERRAASQEINIARAERRPQLTYSINGGIDSNSLGSPDLRQHTGVLAGFSLTIPVFDWGGSRSRERQAQLRMQSVDTERGFTLRGFNQQFNTARTQAVSAAKRAELTRAAIGDAQRNVDNSIARYRAGEASILEVTDAQSTLAAERNALSQALYDYQVGLARLKQAAGK